MSSAVGARIEAPKAPSDVGVGTGEGPGETAMPPPQNFFGFWISSAFWVLFCSSASCCRPYTQKNTALGLRKLAAACKQTAKGGKASLLETTRGTIVSFCVQ